MSIREEYRSLYQREIIEKADSIIFSYSPLTDTYKFLPFCHNVSDNAVEDLAMIMRRNLPFYCYGEEEIVKQFNAGKFDCMEDMIRYSYKQRLPNRSTATDGLLSETLLDLLIQIYHPDAYKLAMRTLFRQNDKNEIKGYDLTYFIKDESDIYLWLGQAKLGGKNYCKLGIDKDLSSKFEQCYLAEQMFFICDKPVEMTEEAKEILSVIEKVNIATLKDDDTIRAKALIKCFKDNNIRIVIPCLLAYGEGTVYSDVSAVYTSVMSEVEEIKEYYNKKNYTFNGFVTEILFYVFPIRDIERLRNKETGFYAGLC